MALLVQKLWRKKRQNPLSAVLRRKNPFFAVSFLKAETLSLIKTLILNCFKDCG